MKESPLHLFFHPDAWDTSEMAGALAAMLDHKNVTGS